MTKALKTKKSSRLKTVSKKIVKKSNSKNVSKNTKTNSKRKVKAKLIDYSHLKRKPFEHQLEAAKFLLDNKKVILGDEMGSGKTTSAILAMNSLKGKRLIICPASLKLNWKKEIKMVSSKETINIIEGKKWIKPTRNSWTIINYDILGNHLEEIKKAGFIVGTFDEVHYCKSVDNRGRPDSKRARYFLQISNKLNFSFLLSGTPITNKTKDIFNLLKAVKHPLSKDFKSFAQKYCDPVFNGFGYSYDGSSNQEDLNEKIQPYMLRRLKEELLELPEKTRSFIPVEVNKSLYLKKVEEYMQKRPNLSHKGEHLVYLNAMRHILAKEKVFHTSKLVDNLLEQNKPTVVFTNYTFVVDSLKTKFPNAVTIVGKNTKVEREQAIQDFQNGKTDLIICNLIAGGVGTTLTRAKNMLINDFDFVPSNHMQAEDRIHRIGQNKDVIIDYIYTEGTVDEKMALLLENKLKNINKIIDNKEEGFLDEIINWFDKIK